MLVSDINNLLYIVSDFWFVLQRDLLRTAHAPNESLNK